jgi:hypothetical protein
MKASLHGGIATDWRAGAERATMRELDATVYYA